MQSQTEWVTGLTAWTDFVSRHPELGYRPGKWGFHNFLRYYKRPLIQRDAIRFAKRRFWVAHSQRFDQIGFECATGVALGLDSDGCCCRAGIEGGQEAGVANGEVFASDIGPTRVPSCGALRRLTRH